MDYSALEDLWVVYQLEKQEVEDSKRDKLYNLMISQEKKIKSYLSGKELNELEMYNDYMDELADYSEKSAFIKGVRLGTQYIIETMLID